MAEGKALQLLANKYKPDVENELVETKPVSSSANDDEGFGGKLPSKVKAKGEVSTAKEVAVDAKKAEVKSSSVSQTTPVKAITDKLSVIAHDANIDNHAVVQSLSTQKDQDKKFNAVQVSQLHSLDQKMVKLNESASEIYKLLKDEKTAPKSITQARTPYGLDTHSVDGNPKDPKHDVFGSIGSLVDSLLGAALMAKAKGVYDKIRGKGKFKSGSLEEEEHLREKARPGALEEEGHGGRPKTPPLEEEKGIFGKIGGKLSGAKDAITEKASGLKTVVTDALHGEHGAKGKLGTVLALGTAAAAGTSYLMGKGEEAVDNADTNSKISTDEREYQNQRIQSGLPPLAGEDLRKLRTQISESQGFIAHPETGFPLNAIQQEAVRSGVMTAESAVKTDNKDIYDAMKAKGVPISTDAMQSVTSNGTNVSSSEHGVRNGLVAATAFGAAAYYGDKMTDHLMGKKPTVSSLGSAPPEIISASDIGKSTSPLTSESVRAPITPAAPRTSNIPERMGLPSPTVAANSPFGAAVDAEFTEVKPQAEARATAVESAPRATVETSATPMAAEGAAKTGAIRSGVKSVGRGFGKALPFVGAAMTAYDAYNIVNDDKATTAQKTGSLVDLGGGTAGAAAGAATGAAIGSVVPVVGTAIGGLVGGAVGYYGGEKLTHGARTWAFGDENDPKSDGGAWGRAKNNSIGTNAKNVAMGALPFIPGGALAASALDYFGSDKKTDTEKKAEPIVNGTTSALAAKSTETMRTSGDVPRDVEVLATAIQTAFEAAFKNILKDNNPETQSFLQSLFGGGASNVTTNTPGATPAGGSFNPSMLLVQPQSTNAPQSSTAPASPTVSGTPPMMLARPQVTQGSSVPAPMGSISQPGPVVSSAKAVNETPPVRATYSPTKQVITNNAPDTSIERVRSTDKAKADLGIKVGTVPVPVANNTTRIDDVPHAAHDNGLGLLNMGII